MKNLPSKHLTRVSGPKAFLHPSVRNAKSITEVVTLSAAGSAMITFITFLAYLNNFVPHGIGDEPIGIWLVVAAILWPIVMYIGFTTKAVNGETEAMQEFHGIARGRASEFLKLRDNVKMTQLRRILDESDHRYSETRRMMKIRIAEATRVFDEAITRFGKADRTPAETIYAETLKRIVTESYVEFETIEAQIATEDERNAKDALEDLSFALADTTRMQPGRTTGSLVQGSGGPRVTHLAATAEKALILDPDLTDAAGGRIDTLVRDHLPRLLATYADLSMAPGGGSDADRAGLDHAVTLIGKSVDEGLAKLRSTKADALRTEIAFLTSRRGETPLSSIPDRSAAA